MSDLLDKISSYNIFNYLLPGTLFAAFADRYTTYSILQEDVLVALFLYYFIGLVISRIGSLLIEPALRKIEFLEFAEYGRFVKASKADEKIDTLSEVNNTYRTLCALFICLLAFTAFDSIATLFTSVRSVAPYVAGAGLLALFLFSWRKQTNYIKKRIEQE